MKNATRLAVLIALALSLEGCAKTVVKTKYHDPVKQPDGDYVALPKYTRTMQRTWFDSHAAVSACDVDGCYQPTVATFGGTLSDEGGETLRFGLGEIAQNNPYAIAGRLPSQAAGALRARHEAEAAELRAEEAEAAEAARLLLESQNDRESVPSSLDDQADDNDTEPLANSLNEQPDRALNTGPVGGSP